MEQSNELKNKLQDLVVKNGNNVDELINMPAAFARQLIKQILYNPQKTSTKTSYTFTTYKKEDITKWLQNPSSNEKNLRNASIYMYIASMHYQRLINYYASLYVWAFVISPLNYNSKKNKEEAFRKQLQKVTDTLELINVPETMRNIMVVALREGAFYGVRWSDNNTSFVQKINADYCQITSMSDGMFLYSVDMSQIKKEKLSFYPPIFEAMYNEYIKSGVKWQEVPSDISVCIKADATMVDFTVPPFAATMPSLYTIANTEALQETADELQNYKMLSGEVPVDKDGNPLIPWDLVTKYYNNLVNAAGDKVGVAVTPFKLTSFDFEKNGSTADIDTINRAISNYWTTAGSSGLLHGVANNTSGVTKLAIKNDESYVSGIMKQAERMFNYYLKTNFNGSIKFKLTFLPITIFNREDYIKMYKESVAFGVGKSYYLAALGIPQYDIEGLSYLEDDILKYNEKLKPLINSHNASAEDLAKGRPEATDDELSDGGEATRDADSNGNT